MSEEMSDKQSEPVMSIDELCSYFNIPTSVMIEGVECHIIELEYSYENIIVKYQSPSSIEQYKIGCTIGEEN